MLEKKDKSIQLIRVVAMMLIIFDHLVSYTEMPMKEVIVQVTNSGVLIFLFISGYLYGNKHINNWKNWFIGRIKKICIPMWIFMVFDFFVEYYKFGFFEIKNIFVYIFNLQGFLGGNIGCHQLWFLSLLMVCYLITPLLQHIKQKEISHKIFGILLIVGIVLQLILAYTVNIGMVVGHTLSWCMLAMGCYMIGYFAGNSICNNKIGIRGIGILTVATILTLIIVLICRRYFDGKIIYDRIIIYYGVIIVDWWLVTILYKMGKYLNNGFLTKIIEHIALISYEVYIVHGLIIIAVSYQWIASIGIIPYIVGTILLSYISAWILRGICSLIYKVTKMKK